MFVIGLSSSTSNFSLYWSIHYFCNVVSVSIFYFKIVSFFLLHPDVDFSLCHLHQLIGRIFFRWFRKTCFVCIAWTYTGIFWISFLSPISFYLFLLVVLSDLSIVVFWRVFSFCPFPVRSIFFHGKFHSYILAVNSYHLYQDHQAFFIFGKYLYIIHVIHLFSLYSKFVASLPPRASLKYVPSWVESFIVSW